MVRTVLVRLAYDGAPFSGLVVQQNAPTVGGALIAALRHIDPSVDRIRVASRTDAGVHARDQRVAFDTRMSVPNRAWVRGPMPYLPSSIVVMHAASVRNGFNPRFETVRKRYRYLLLGQHRADPFLAHRSWRVGPVLQDEAIALMAAELEGLLGTHDFAGFASSHDRRKHTERTMAAVRVQRLSVDPAVVAIDITGDGFLHNMVRIIVGTVVDVARRRLGPGAIRRALASRDREDLGVTAPAAGLYLEKLDLEDEGCDRWPPATGGELPG